MSGFLASLLAGFGNILKGVGVVARDVVWAATHLYAAHEKVVEAGWFPSQLLPYQKMANEVFRPGFSADSYLTKYFVEDFDAFEREFKSRIQSRGIDSHTEALLHQAMAAHKARLYYCVAPAIFAELERVIRVSLGVDRLGSRRIRDLFRKMKDANFAALVAVGPVALTDVLTEHVYKDTWGISEPEIRFLNRHQVMHGFKLGSGSKDSLNALLLAESVISFLSWKSTIRENPPGNSENGGPTSGV